MHVIWHLCKFTSFYTVKSAESLKCVSIMKKYSWSINQPAGRLPLFTPTLKLLLVQSAPAHKVTYHSCESWARHAGWESSLAFFTTHWFVCWVITCRYHDSAGPPTYDLWPVISWKVCGTDDKNVACLVQRFKAYWYISNVLLDTESNIHTVNVHIHTILTVFFF